LRALHTFNIYNIYISFIVCFDFVLVSVVFYFTTYLLVFHFFYFNSQTPPLFPSQLILKYSSSFIITFHFRFISKNNHLYSTLTHILTHTLTHMLPPTALTPTRCSPVYFNLTPLFLLCVVHGHHVIHGARSSGMLDDSISPSQDNIFLRFLLWFDPLNTTSINFIYITFTLKIPP